MHILSKLLLYYSTAHTAFSFCMAMAVIPIALCSVVLHCIANSDKEQTQTLIQYSVRPAR